MSQINQDSIIEIVRLAKVAAEKQSFAGLVGAGIGGAVGAANLPNDATSADRARYASQGALRGGGLGSGASVGAGLGYLGSKALMRGQKDPSSLRTTIATLLPFLTGAAGGTLGYDIGDQFARNPGFALDDKSSAGDEAEADKREETTKEAALKGLVLEKIAESAAWQRKAGKNSEGGLNSKGRASYNKATGGNLKAPVTSKKPKGKAKKRKASFCARMGGMKKKNTSKATANDPDSRINKSLRKWNC